MDVVPIIISIVSTTIAIGSFIAAVVFGLRKNRREDHDDVKEYTKQQTRQTLMLELMSKDVAEVKSVVEKTDGKVDKLNERVFKVEHDMSTWWRVIDEIKAFIGFGKEQK